MRVFALFGLLALAASAEEAPAGETPAKIAMSWMKKFDTNNDGAITKGEYQNAEFFKKYDGDGDGKVTAQEIRNQEEELRKGAVAKMPKKRDYFRGLDDFGEHDANGDGKFTKKELESYILDGADRDRDGMLSEDEYKNIDRRPRGDDAQDVKLENFDQLDTNKNGKLTLDEFVLSAPYFTALDRDADGSVSKEDLILTVLDSWGGVPGPTADLVMRRMDANRDGELDRKEFDGNDKLWNQINGGRPEKEDPTISKEEIENYLDRVRELRAKANSFMARYDLNGDGKVTRDEFDGPDGAFDRCDTNGDGLITKRDGVE